MATPCPEQFRLGVYALFDNFQGTFEIPGGIMLRASDYPDGVLEGNLDRLLFAVDTPSARQGDSDDGELIDATETFQVLIPNRQAKPYSKPSEEANPLIWINLGLSHDERETTSLDNKRYTVRGNIEIEVFAEPPGPANRHGGPSLYIPAGEELKRADAVAKEIVRILRPGTLNDRLNKLGRLAKFRPGFRAYLLGAVAEETGAFGKTFRIRIRAPFEYYGQDQEEEN